MEVYEKKCAICIPTYNRSEVVDELLVRCLKTCLEFQYDLWIFDSSDNNETRRVVDLYRKDYSVLNYQRMDSNMHSGEKVYSIFEWASLKSEYDYLWIIGDSFCWNKNVMHDVRGWIENDFDLLVVDDLDPDRLGVRVYDDANALFRECAWRMTLFGATVLNVNRLLNDVNWEQVRKMYLVPETINHSHVLLYFTRILELSNFKALHIGVSKESKIGTTHKKKNGWWDNVFYIWMDCWKTSISKLPEQYISKNQVIQSHGIKSGLFTLDGFLKLRRLGVLTREIYLKYKKEWQEFTNVNPCVIGLISIMPIKCLWFSEIRKWPQMRFEIKLKRCMNKYDSIIIYGCGNRAKAVVDIMGKYGKQPKLYIVSDVTSEKNNVDGVAVAKYDSQYLEDENTLLVVALNKRNAIEIRRVLNEESKSKCKIIYSDY